MSEKIFNFDVTGIHCEGCAGKISKGLTTSGMALKVDVDVAKGKVKVDATEKTTVMMVKGQLEKLGYKVLKFENMNA